MNELSGLLGLLALERYEAEHNFSGLGPHDRRTPANCMRSTPNSLENGRLKINSYGEHLVDFCPELFVVIDRNSPFLANQSASKGRLQTNTVQNDLSSFGTLPEEILPVLLA